MKKKMFRKSAAQKAALKHHMDKISLSHLWHFLLQSEESYASFSQNSSP